MKKKKKKCQIFIPIPANKTTDHHHIIPKSRKGRGDSNNYIEINKELHKHYHSLFGNLTPDEIICYLVKDFWNNQIDWIDKALLSLKNEREAK